MKLALRNYTPGPDDDTYPVVEVAWQQAVYPEKGFDLILDRNGVCSAITAHANQVRIALADFLADTIDGEPGAGRESRGGAAQATSAVRNAGA